MAPGTPANLLADPIVMARQEHTREDLLAEATALVERVEIALDGSQQHVVVGFRRDGSASIYFGEDPAYHFNSQGELRRAYLDGRLLKAERGRLVAMTRERTDREVQLLSRELSTDETARVVEDLIRRIAALAQLLDGRRYQVVGKDPIDADVLVRGRSLLHNLAAELIIAQSPHVR
jgi:hypothetical protein